MAGATRVSATSGDRPRRSTPRPCGARRSAGQGRGRDRPAASRRHHRFQSLEWGAYAVGRAQADVTLSNGRASDPLDGAVARHRTDATIDLDARTFAATAAVVNADLAALLAVPAESRRRGSTGRRARCIAAVRRSRLRDR